MTTPTDSVSEHTADPLVPRGFESWATCLVGVVQRSWRPMLGVLALGFWVPWVWLTALLVGLGPATSLLIIPGALPEMHWNWYMVLLALPVPLTWGVGAYLAAVAGIACVRIATAHAAGLELSAREAYLASLRPAWPLWGWSLLAGLCVWVGLLAYWVPGIIVAFGLSLVLPVMVYERRRPFARSVKLIDTNIGAALGRVLPLALACGGYVLLLGYAAVGLHQGVLRVAASPVDQDSFFMVSRLLWGLLETGVGLLALPAVVISLAGILVTYTELRARRESLTTEDLIEEAEG